MEKSKRLLLNSIFPFIQLTPQYDGPSSPIAGITATSSLYAANDLRRWLVLATVHEIPPTFLVQVLEAFASWLRLRRGISPSVLASHPLAHTALSSLSSEIISEASVNVVSELIHCSAVGNSSDTTMQLPLIQIIVPQVMNLRPLLSDRSKDEEDVKAIGRLFADMGDSYVKLIATGSDESMMIVNALLEVAAHPEFDIASMTFNFWHNLQIFLIERDLYLSFGSEASIEAEKNRRLLIFRPAYETLVSLVSFRVQYPDDYMELSREDIKDFKQTRYEQERNHAYHVQGLQGQRILSGYLLMTFTFDFFQSCYALD